MSGGNIYLARRLNSVLVPTLSRANLYFDSMKSNIIYSSFQNSMINSGSFRFKRHSKGRKEMTTTRGKYNYKSRCQNPWRRFKGLVQGEVGKMWYSRWSRWKGQTTLCPAEPPRACEDPGGQRWCTGCRGPGRIPAKRGRRQHWGFEWHHCRVWVADSAADLLRRGAAWPAPLFCAT